MTKQSNPVFDGLALGLKPVDLELPEDSVHVGYKLIRARDRIRMVLAVERQSQLAEQNLTAQQRSADAAERSAVALETIAALFASCIGVSNMWCPGDANETPTVNYFRASADGQPYRCDRDDDDDED